MVYMQSTGVDDEAEARKSVRWTPLVLLLVLLLLKLCTNGRERHKSFVFSMC